MTANLSDAGVAVNGQSSKTTDPPPVDRIVSSAHVTRLIMGLAAGLRLWQYVGNPSLTLDELAVARNILSRPLSRLLTIPLDYSQVAPPGFLLGEKAAVAAFGPTEYALRLLPLVCALASVVAFRRVAARVLNPLSANVALLLFAIGPVLIFHGSEVKQYSSDVAAALLLIGIALYLGERLLGPRRWCAAAVVGAVIVWCSQAAVLMVAGLGGAIVWFAARARDRASARRTAYAVSVWAASALAVTVASMQSMRPETRGYMHRFWHNAFMPMPPRTLPQALWLWDRLSDVFGPAGLSYPWPWLAVTLMAWGFVVLWRRSRETTLTLLAPVLVALAASAAQQYPFADRAILFLTPIFVLAVAATIGQLYAIPRVGRTLAAALVAVPIVGVIVEHPVYVLENARPLFAYVETHRRPGDAIYVYYAGWQAYRYYGPRYGFSSSAADIGGCHRGDPHAYLIEVDRLRGRPRAWILFVHALRRLGEQSIMEDYLDQIGHRLDHAVFPGTYARRSFEPATADLYDLSDTTLLPQTSATEYLAVRPAPTTQRGFFATGVCDRGPQVPVEEYGHSDTRASER